MMKITFNHVETSKLILYISYTTAIFFTCIIAYGNLKGLSMGDLATITGINWGEVAAANGFYYWKAKNENRSKYVLKFIQDLSDKEVGDNVARLCEVVIKD